MEKNLYKLNRTIFCSHSII